MGYPAVNLETHRYYVVTDAHHSRDSIVKVLPAHLEPGTLLRVADKLTSHQNHAPLRRLPGKRQLALPHVSLLSHDCGHRYLALADQVVTSTFVHIYDFKLDLLRPFIEVIQRETRLEVRV